jgi:hypothetical protein
VSAAGTAGARGAEAGGFADENACPDSAGCDAVPTVRRSLHCQEPVALDPALADITPGNQALESGADLLGQPAINPVHAAALDDADPVDGCVPANGDCPSTLAADAVPTASNTRPRVRGPAKPREYALPDMLGAIVEYEEYGALDSDAEAGEMPHQSVRAAAVCRPFGHGGTGR